MPRFQHGVWAGNPGKPTTSIEGNDDTTSYLYFPVINHKLRKAIVGWSSWSQVDGNWQKAFLWWGANRWFSLLFQNLHNPKFSSFFWHCTKFLAPQRDAKFVLQESGCVEFLGHLPNLEEHLSDPTPEGHLGSPETEQLSAEAGWSPIVAKQLCDWNCCDCRILPQMTWPFIQKWVFQSKKRGLVPLVRRQFWECAAPWMI